ncbi:MAG: DnaA regulatory inactivator Hda [Xanthomonadaceae bacterium]|nr:DnaA regulatory inactivator Hda [Xanthomonadaceae bacterium]
MHPQLPLGLRLGDHARFRNFFAGPNAEVLAALRVLAEAGARMVYCSGAPGTGKSHLLQATCAAAREQGRTAWYLPLEPQLSPAVLEGLEQQEVLCLDDLQRVAGHAAWEEALFHLYNRVREQEGVLLVAGDGRPEELGLALPDLVSRLHWGLLYRLRELDDAERLAALQLRAASRGLDLPVETGDYLLRRCPRDLPALFELLDRLDLASLAAQRRLTIPFVRAVLLPGNPGY